MGFALRFLIGVAVLSLYFETIHTFHLKRPVRQINKDGGNKSFHKLQGIENETKESNKPKTDASAEDNKTINLNNERSLENSKLNIKSHKAEPYKKSINETHIKKLQEDIARSIDINKYISKEFHNKNNVYTLPVSTDTEKFLNSEYSDYHSTTQKNADFNKDYFCSDLTTPKSEIFDLKFKEAVDSVDQKLDEIDHLSKDMSESEDEESEKDVTVDKLLQQAKNNHTETSLNYINYKSIVANDTNKKKSVHKDLVLEAGTNLNFHSSFNKTLVTNDNEKDNGNNTILNEPVYTDADRKVSTSSTMVDVTKPTNINVSQISTLNNKIEKEEVKNIEPIQSNYLITTEKTIEKDTSPDYLTKKSPLDVTKRGSIKFIDYAPTASTQRTALNTKNHSASNQDVIVLENQIIQVQVEPPKDFKERANASLDSESTSTLNPLTKETTTTTELISTTTTDFSTMPGIELGMTTMQSESTTPNDATTESFESTTSSTFQMQTTLSDAKIVTTEMGESTTEVHFERETMESTINITTEETKRTSKLFNFDNNRTTTSEDENTTTTETSNVTEEVTVDVEYENDTTIYSTVKTSEYTEYQETVDYNYTLRPESITTTIPTNFFTTTETVEPEVTENYLNNGSETLYTDIINNITLQPDLFKPEVKYVTMETITSTENSTTPSDSELKHPEEDNSGTIAAITISAIGAVCLILLAGLLFIMRKRQKRFNYGQRCTPVSLDDYSMDNVSVYNSVRRKELIRSSKRSYGNPAFEDPSSVSHPLNFLALTKFLSKLDDIQAEFEEIPQITAKTNELPEGCDAKNRYANVIPLPETRVFLKLIDGYPNSDYINANYVTGPKNARNYYIACQAPLQNTVDDFWRMVWEQQSKVVLMLTHLFENGMEKCVDYLPPSEVSDCHRLFGDFQITLKKREVKDKYIISILQLKNMVSNSWREVTHLWYIGWPEKGVPSEANSLIAFLIEARSYMKSSPIDKEEVTNGNIKIKATMKKDANPVVVHCSPGTGRTGTVIACDIAIREFEQCRLVDIPRIVYKIRRDRASSVQTKEQYTFIYKVVSLYATKLTGGAFDSL